MDAYDKWVAALRSDKYSQTQGILKDKSGMCCLGVACDISNLGYWDFSTYIIPDEIPYSDDASLLPPVARWLNLQLLPGDTNVRFNIFEVQYPSEVLKAQVINSDRLSLHLSNLNDDLNWDFKTIADFLELNKDYFQGKLVPING